MDIEKAEKILNITDDEENALFNYLEFKHAKMNALVHYNPSDYMEISKLGYVLPGLSSDQTPEQATQEALDTFDDIAKLYSLMCKCAGSAPSQVIRGTSIKEASRLYASDSYKKIISTTSSREVADRFSRPYSKAILFINVDKNMPCIDVTGFVGKDRLQRYESEYILPPFSKIEKKEILGKDNTTDYYSLTLTKPVLRPFQEGEKENLKQMIKRDFSRMISLGKEYASLVWQWEDIRKKLGKPGADPSLSQRFDMIRKRINEISNEQMDFISGMNNYVEGLCEEKERELAKAHEVIKQDREKRRLEREKIAEEKRKIEREKQKTEKIAELSEKSVNFGENADSIPNAVKAEYEALKMQEQRYSNLARKLGIPYTLNIDNNYLQEDLQKINQNIELMKEKISTFQGREYNSLEDVTLDLQDVDKYNFAIQSATEIAKGLGGISKDYEGKACQSIKEGIYIKAKSILKGEKLKRLYEKKKEIEGRKISLFGRIRGLEKIKKAELKNINLQIQLEKSLVIQPTEDISISSIFAEVAVFEQRNSNGHPSQQISDLKKIIIENFLMDKTKLNYYIERYNQTSLAVIPNRQYKGLRTGKKVKMINDENQGLEARIADVKGRQFIDRTSINTYSSVARFNKIVRDISRATSVPERTERTNEQIRTSDDASRSLG